MRWKGSSQPTYGELKNSQLPELVLTPISFEQILESELTRSEKLHSVLTLLNLISDPALIYNRTSDRILAVNNHLIVLAGLDEDQLAGQEIQRVLPNLVDTDPITGHGQKVRLRTKNKPLIPVTIRIYAISKSNQNVIIAIDSQPSKKQENEGDIQKRLIKGLKDIIDSKGNASINAILKSILRKAQELLHYDTACIYKASGDKPQLSQFIWIGKNSRNDLPNILTSEDLSHIQSSQIWIEDQPPISQIQKSAASANYNYLCVVPLGKKDARFGLFVTGSKQELPNTQTLALNSLIGAYISSLMESHIALHNARSMANRVKQVARIQSTIISNLDEGIIILSPDLTVAEINPAAETILGYTNEEALRHEINTILIGSESLGSAFRSAKQGIPTLIGGDLTLHHRNGKSFPAQVMTVPVLSNDALLSIVLLLRDMSQEEQTRAANKQLEQRAILGEVTAIFAHEVRNPINALNLALQVMEENITPEDENAKWIKKMRGECDSLTQLMESVLSFARPLEYKMANVDLEFMLSRLIERWRPRLRRLEITYTLKSDIKAPIAKGDIRALEQVFTNLISNAVNAMSEKGGHLSINITPPEDPKDEKYHKVIITDTGPGIPDDFIEQIFTPFVTGSENGTGLGLAITQRIVSAHQGRIEVNSVSGGTIFTVYLKKKKENEI